MQVADYADQQAAWQVHQALVAASPYTGLKWRSVGPVVQGGRLVDVEVDSGNAARLADLASLDRIALVERGQ